jgi:hypothetical protein
MARNEVKDKAKIIEKLQEIPIITLAVQQVGIPRSTYYRWRQIDFEFARKCDEAASVGIEHIVDLAQMTVIQKIKDGDLNAARYVLDRLDVRYRPNRRNDIEEQVSAPLSEEAQRYLAKAARSDYAPGFED